MRKTKLTPYESAKGKGVEQNYDFQDDIAKVQACAFNDVAKMLDRFIEPGKRFEISKAAVNKLFSKPVTGYHNVELMLFSHSIVNPFFYI